MILARIFFFLVVSGAVGILAYLLYDKVIHPLLFKEEMEHKLEEAGEDYVETQVEKAANKLRKGGRV